MGLFDNLFKSKPAPGEESVVDAARRITEAEKARLSEAEKAAKPASQQKSPGSGNRSAHAPVARAYSPRSLGQAVPPRSAPRTPSKAVRFGAAGESGRPQEIRLYLDDVLTRIPPELLNDAPREGRREIRFRVEDVSADIARGRAAVALVRIAEQVPEIFREPVPPTDETLIRLPLQKLVEQIGFLPVKPAPDNRVPKPGPAVQPAPPGLRSPPAVTPPVAPLLSGESTSNLETVTFPSRVPQGDSIEPVSIAPAAPSEAVPPEAADEAAARRAVGGSVDSIGTLSQPEGSPDEKASADPTISLSLSAVLRDCPREIICAALPPIQESDRIRLALAPIRKQIHTGQIEISSVRFVFALPPHLQHCFEAREGVKVPLPLDEVLRNLPDSEVTAEQLVVPPPIAPPGPSFRVPGATSASVSSAETTGEAKAEAPAAVGMPTIPPVLPTATSPPTTPVPAVITEPEVGGDVVEEPTGASLSSASAEEAPVQRPEGSSGEAETSAGLGEEAPAAGQEEPVATPAPSEPPVISADSDSSSTSSVGEAVDSGQVELPGESAPATEAAVEPGSTAPDVVDFGRATEEASETLTREGHFSAEPQPVEQGSGVPGLETNLTQTSEPDPLIPLQGGSPAAASADASAPARSSPHEAGSLETSVREVSPFQFGEPSSFVGIQSRVPEVPLPETPASERSEGETYNAPGGVQISIPALPLVPPPAISPTHAAQAPQQAREEPAPVSDAGPGPAASDSIPVLPPRIVPPPISLGIPFPVEKRMEPQPEAPAAAEEATPPEPPPVATAEAQALPSRDPAESPVVPLPVFPVPPPVLGGVAPSGPREGQHVEPPPSPILPVRVVSPPALRPLVAPPPLFGVGLSEDEAVPEPMPSLVVAPPVEEAPAPPPPPPPPPPLELAGVRAVLGLSEEDGLAGVGRKLTELPGLYACLITVRHEAELVGEIQEGLDADGIRTLGASIAASIAASSVGPVQHVTVFSEDGCISVFARGSAVLCALHRTRAFLPGVREKLLAATAALSEA